MMRKMTVILAMMMFAVSMPAAAAVSPDDVGVAVGPGTYGWEYPTEIVEVNERNEYIITEDNTVVSGVIINGCIRVYGASNVTVMNTVVNCDGQYPVYLRDAERFVLSQSKVNCSTPSKLFNTLNSPDLSVFGNELVGCGDWFYMNGDIGYTQITNNYIHSVVGPPTFHADGFQIGQSTPTHGDMLVMHNWFDKDNNVIGATDLLFAARYSHDVEVNFISNHFEPWGYFTLRCPIDETMCIASHNEYANSFRDFDLGGVDPLNVDVFVCNKYEDGELLASSEPCDL